MSMALWCLQVKKFVQGQNENRFDSFELNPVTAPLDCLLP